MVSINPTSFDEEDFVPVCKIGHGGLGTVSLFFKKSANTLRAVKFSISAELSGKSLTDFVREFQTIYSSTHPSIIRSFSFGIPSTEHKNNPWMELEYIPCGTLTDLIDKIFEEDEISPEINPSTLIKILFGTSYGIAFLHEKNVIHRDIKPANIMLNCDLEPKIGDFGFARELRPIDDVSSYPYTINYAAPELLEGKIRNTNYTNKVDVFSFGMTIYECRMLEVPFADDNHGEIMNHILKGQFPTLPSTDPFFEIYSLCTSFNPEQRPTMVEVTHMLNDIAYNLSGVDIDSFEEYKERITSYKDGDPIPDSGSPENLIRAASIGLPQAQYHLGCLYYHGIVYEKNVDTAAEYFKKASDQNYLEAMNAYLSLADDEEIYLDDEEIESLSDRIEQVSANVSQTTNY